MQSIGDFYYMRGAVISEYIHFTQRQKERASSVDLVEFLQRRGEKLIPSGKEKRLERDHSVTVSDNTWYDHAEERGGGPISFVEWFYGLNYQDAVSLLLGGEQGTVYPRIKEKPPAPPKPFELPPVNGDMRRVYAYLMQHRCIDRKVIDYFAKARLLYEDAQYHNAAFVGRDEDGIPRHAHKRSTSSIREAFRINVESSDPRYSFHHIGTDGSLYVFEAPIDLLSYITMHPENWEAHSYVACCGTSFQPVQKLLERMPQTERVYLCVDNDHAGYKTSQRMAEKMTELGLNVERFVPVNKDWNEDLVMKKQEESEVQSQCQTFGY